MEIVDKVSRMLEAGGFECHSFKIGWYNALVGEKFRFALPKDTLAILVISTPRMFEDSFLPFLSSGHECLARDPIDECVARQLQHVTQELGEVQMEAIHDFEMTHTRRPRVLVQTAGHVAGAATYYQRSDLEHDPWPADKKIFGASVHPRYGGWFALRAVLIFKDIQIPELEKKEPPNVLPTDDLKRDFLEKFNFHWQDWSFRDVIPTEDRYSDRQKLYFETLPKNRNDLVKSWREL